MENISLMEYLQIGPSSIPTNPPTHPSGNTTNTLFSYTDILHVGRWQQFNVTAIRQRYGNLLTATMLPPNPFPTSPPNSIGDKSLFGYRIREIIVPRLRRALRAGFQQLRTIHQLAGLTPIGIDSGSAAANPGGIEPDLAYFDLGLELGTGPNRGPFVLKTSWKWNTAMQTGSPNEQNEFLQVLSEVNWHMIQHGSRYSVVLTDLELVAIRRLDDNGNLELSVPVPWEVKATAEHPRLTVLLALWYMGMLAAQDQGADQWRME